MELAGKYIALFHRSMDWDAIFRGSLYNGRIRRLQVIRMHEVYEGSFPNPFKQPSLVHKMQAVPSDMGDFKAWGVWNPPDAPLQDMEGRQEILHIQQYSKKYTKSIRIGSAGKGRAK